MKSIALAFSCFLVFSSAAVADDADTFKGLLALAIHGDAEAQYHVGMMYNNGIGIGQDTKQAFQWFQKATAAKDPLGAYKLGCYYAGQGAGVVNTDPAAALKHKLVAAEAGYSLAQFDVAVIYAGQGKFEEAAKWLQKSADQGDDRALYGLSSLHQEGQGVPKDLGAAYAYFELSIMVSQQLTEANRSRLDDMTARTTEAERAKAAQIVANWKPKPTALTIEAQNGIAAAEEHLRNAKE
jgi:uncharacterized protein